MGSERYLVTQIDPLFPQKLENVYLCEPYVRASPEVKTINVCWAEIGVGCETGANLMPQRTSSWAGELGFPSISVISRRTIQARCISSARKMPWLVGSHALQNRRLPTSREGLASRGIKRKASILVSKCKMEKEKKSKRAARYQIGPQEAKDLPRREGKLSEGGRHR